jgi:hypothetical protein
MSAAESLSRATTAEYVCFERSETAAGFSVLDLESTDAQ